MGVKTNQKKLQDFADKQKYLGFIFNGRDKTVRLPAEKIVYLLPHMKAHMRGLHNWLKVWKKPNAKRKISRKARVDLERWKLALTTFEPRRIVPTPVPEDVNWVGDASTGFGIGVKIGERWTRYKLKKEWKEENLFEDETCRNIAWAEFAAIRIGLLMLKELTETKGRNFLVFRAEDLNEKFI